MLSHSIKILIQMFLAIKTFWNVILECKAFKDWCLLHVWKRLEQQLFSQFGACRKKEGHLFLLSMFLQRKHQSLTSISEFSRKHLWIEVLFPLGCSQGSSTSGVCKISFNFLTLLLCQGCQSPFLPATAGPKLKEIKYGLETVRVVTLHWSTLGK